MPAINTRLDEPGLSVFPHATVIADDNNEELTYIYGTTKNPSKEQDELIQENNFIAEQYINRIVKSTKACKNKADNSIKKAGNFLNKNAKKGLEKAKPYIVLRVNRRANWRPVSVRSADESLNKALIANKGKFTKDTVYFTCEETD